jgi:hypothetical protein
MPARSLTFASSKNSSSQCILQPTTSGRHVRTGIRQSMPSVSIESCGGVNDTAPSLACFGLRRHEFAAFQPLGIQHQTLAIPSQNLQEMTVAPPEQEQAPLNRSCPSWCWTMATKPSKPGRISVTPAATQMRTSGQG